jgi:3-methyladenine DNA glycosylase/8-oxoguanine DNA glycosylase
MAVGDDPHGMPRDIVDFGRQSRGSVRFRRVAFHERMAELTDSFFVEVPTDLDVLAMVAATANGPRDPTIRRHDDGIHRSFRLADGPATARFRQPTPTTAEITCWGPGASELARRVPGLLGLEDDLAGFDPSRHPVVHDQAQRFRQVRLGASGDVWGALLAAVLGQRVVGKEADESFRRLVHRLGDPAPGPAGLTMLPDPAVVARTGSWEFHRAGVERARSDTIVRVAREMPRLPRLVDGPLAPRARLEAIRGVGPWTSAAVAQTAFGDADAVLVGDYHLPNVVAWNLAGEARADDARMLELLEPFAGHRARVAMLVERHGQRAPRYGPRMAFRRIERH